MADWDNEYLSKKQIYNRLRELSYDYGKFMAINKQSAVLHCMDVLMLMTPADIPQEEKWVNVNDRTPDDQQSVIVYAESRMMKRHVTSCTYFKGWGKPPRWSRRKKNVTHWMPMPRPPKG